MRKLEVLERQIRKGAMRSSYLKDRGSEFSEYLRAGKFFVVSSFSEHN